MFWACLRKNFSFSSSQRVVFFGSGKVGLPSLRTLAGIYPQLQVVTQSSLNQKKAFNEVQIESKQSRLKWSAPITNRKDKIQREKEWQVFINQMGKADLGVVCSFGYMIPNALIDKFSRGLIIVHPSLLPKYRGGSPIFHAIANGDSISGVSYLQISKGAFDQGNILHQVQTPISLHDTYGQVQSHLADFAARHLPYVIQSLDKLRPGKSQKQLQKTVDPRFIKAPIVKDKHLDLNRPAQSVFHMSRALMSSKVTFAAINKQIFITLQPKYRQQQGEVGDLKVFGKKLYVRCADKYVRVLSFYQPTRTPSHTGNFIQKYMKSFTYAPNVLRFT